MFLNLKPEENKRLDEYSPFRYFIKRARELSKKEPLGKFREYDITVEYLKEKWEEQKGVCPYSGRKMLLAEKSSDLRNSPFYASLDRIDSSKGYLKGNVEFVCLAVNLAKSSFKKSEAMKFFNEIRKIFQKTT